MQQIHERGHMIGIHPSYQRHYSDEPTRHEPQLLREAKNEAGIQKDQMGGRQHHLHWSNATTAYWKDEGLAYDSAIRSLSYSRFGSRTYRVCAMFHLKSPRTLALNPLPLVVAELIVLSDLHVGLGQPEAALTHFAVPQDVCRRDGDPFTCSWHNSNGQAKQDRSSHEALTT